METKQVIIMVLSLLFLVVGLTMPVPSSRRGIAGFFLTGLALLVAGMIVAGCKVNVIDAEVDCPGGLFCACDLETVCDPELSCHEGACTQACESHDECDIIEQARCIQPGPGVEPRCAVPCDQIGEDCTARGMPDATCLQSEGEVSHLCGYP